MQKLSDENPGGGHSTQFVAPDLQFQHDETCFNPHGVYDVDQLLSGSPDGYGFDNTGAGVDESALHYEPGASEASPSIAQSEFLDEVPFKPADSTPTLAQPVVSSAVYDAIFARNLFSNFDATCVKLPWEEGIFKEIFNDEPLSDALVPKMPVANLCSFDLDEPPLSVAESSASVADPSSMLPVFESCISSGDDLHFHSKRQQLRDAAIGKFLVVLRYNLEVSVTGKQILEEGLHDQHQQRAYEIVDAVLGAKSPATLIKRANALLAFMRWCTCWKS